MKRGGEAEVVGRPRGEGFVLRHAGTGRYAAFRGGSPSDGSGLVLADGEEAAPALVAAGAIFRF